MQNRQLRHLYLSSKGRESEKNGLQLFKCASDLDKQADDLEPVSMWRPDRSRMECIWIVPVI